MTRRFLNLILALCFMALGPASLRAEEYLCPKISLAQNLSHSNVTALSRDGHGFLWIGTRFGLNRYDFERTTNYYHAPTDTTSLPGNSILALFTDSRGQLWVATEHGAARYDMADNSFERLSIKGKRLDARCFVEDGNGLLIGEIGKVFYYDFASGSISELQTKGGSKYPYCGIYRRSPDSYILATRWDGIWLFDRTRATITRFPGITEKHITACAIDSNGVLYYSPYGEGLRAYDRAGTPLFAFTSANSPLRNNIVLDLCEHEGRIWVATDGGGISIFNPTEETFDNSQTYHFLSELGSVTTLHTDRHHNVYAGTVREGAVCIVPTALRTIRHSNDRQPMAISSLCHDSEGRVWVGSDGRGVLLYNPETDKFDHIPSTSNLKVTDIIEHDAGHMLLVSFTDGFFLLDKNTGRLSDASPALKSLWNNRSNRGVPIHLRQLAPNNISIISDKIVTYDPHTGKVNDINLGPKFNPGAMIPFFCQNGRLLCYANDCVVDFDPVTHHMAPIYSLEPGGHVFCAAYDGYNSLYLSMDQGIICHDLTTGEDRPIENVPDRASAIACDPGGRVWLATTRAIHMIKPETGIHTVFGLNDGVIPNEYIGSAVLNDNSNLLLPGIYGMVRIQTSDLDESLAQRPDPEIFLADLQIDGKSVYKQIKDGQIEVPQHFSTINLSAIDDGPDSQRRSQFRFIISNGGERRVAQTDSRTVDLSFLKSGETYNIELSCLRPDGSWTRPRPLVRMAVMAPWFKSPWMWAAALALLTLVWLLWELRMRRQRKLKMQRQIETYRNSAMEREIAFLVNTNYALRTPLTLIYAPLKLTLERLRRGDEGDIIPELERVYQNTKKMRDTIDMALELHSVNTRPDSGKLTTHDVSRSIGDAISTIAPEAATKHIAATYLSAQSIFPAIYDRERIATVLEIFLRNAIQRSSEHTTVEVLTTMHDGIIHVAISDHGDPVDPDILPEIFSRYFHPDQTTFDNSIEFAYAKNIVELHEGNVGAENTPDGSGLTVWFEIPAAGQSAADAYTRRRLHPQTTAAAPTGSISAGGAKAEIEPIVAGIDTSAMTALVVEADNDLCLFISSQLAEHFGKVYHAFNGKDALLMTKQYQPDIVISSLRLPGISGLELCQAIKRTHDTSHIPVILLTALKEGSAHENAYESGADSYLAKPFDLNILMARCRNILHTRSVIRKRYADLPKKDDKVTHTLSNADETFLLKLNKIISENISNPEFSVTTLVDVMATSRSALYTKFKEITGQTLGSYISDMRLRKACELLTQTDMPVNEISDLLGFNSQRYFSTFFKSRIGQTPSDYRSTHPHQPT